MVHCDECCLRLSVNKDKTLPKHYLEDTHGILSHREQKTCPGSSTTQYTTDRQLSSKCRRPRSKQTCPCCGRKPLTLNKNGKFPKHKAPGGAKCSMSEANYPR
ncbi:hypothetical protein GCM10012275_59080 [Longimycelium tulufanense]|uniref:Uncharacterized protein n=1 Tax=Longimycelium tulufanense TaxID=907463 RepID=A0A8J3FZI3_9PSEU|nr:hypothetical protein GCM10012275_59080 [Longimycelium tulufanense]